MNVEVYAENYEKGYKAIFENRRNSRRPGEVYVEDGVIAPEVWFSQKVRPLFLLKEAYGEGEDWSLVNHLMPPEGDRKESCGATWRKITQWTYGILGTDTAHIPVFDNQAIPKPMYGNEMLKHIAVVNVKKTQGKSNSTMKEINKVAEEDRLELQKQIALCNPTVIICGYTVSSLNMIMAGETDRGIKDYSYPNQNWYYKFELNGKEIIVIDYYHPSNQFPDLLNYYALMQIYQLALKESRKAEFKIEVSLEV